MFDTVGKTIDPDAGRRQAYSAALTLALIGSVVGGAFLYVTWKAAQIVYQEVFVDDELVEVEMVEPEEVELALPPPPPMKAGGLADEEEPETPVEPVADEMQEDIQTLDEQVSSEVLSQAGDPNAKGTTEGSSEGSEGGTPGGTGPAGPRTFHHSEVRIKTNPSPVYPDAAKDLNLGDVNCRVRIFIDTDGVPYDFVFEACPKVFHESATSALQKWRWYPARMDGEKVSAQFVMVFKYTLK